MEKIKVNMSPNPLDVQTIHASQNDGEARQWEFELHNNGELIDTSEVTEQLVFKAYKGGTEQILPENGSTPTTSPFLGDIRYPQGLLNDQEFTYRQSPTESDGLAKITDIKGNTLVWNQLVQNGNFASSSGWGINGGTLAVANNIATLTANSSVAYVQIYRDGFMLNTNHKYLIKFNYNATNITNFLRAIVNSTDGSTYVQLGQNTSNSGTFNVIVTPSLSATRLMFAFVTNGNANGSGTISNVQVFDLTQMGLDISSPSDFASLFPLSYYSYNQGSLLSFNGNGIKTTGKNLLEPPTSGSVNGVTFTVNSDGSITVNGTATSNGTYDFYRNQNVLPSWAKAGETYTLSLTNAINRFDIFSYDSSGTSRSLASVSAIASQMFTIPNDAVGLLIRMFVSSGITYDVTVYPQIEIGTSATSYEPYTSHTTNLPISTYFPTGMKSAGNVYDEWTPSKATTRVRQLILDGTQTPRLTGITVNQVFSFDNLLASAPCKTVNTNITSIYEIGTSYATIAYDTPKVAFSTPTTPLLIFPSGRFSNVSELLTYLQSKPVPINYELATPTETSFSTASLVTENAEIPLSNEDGVLIGKCTEELSAEPGFHDAKIKLSDADGECYSNKIQLHVERSPQ